MHQFVWARALCGIRYGYPAAVDCSGTIQKIYMRKIRVSQGDGRACKCCRFQHSGMFDEKFWDTSESRGSGFALTRNVSSSHGSKNLIQRAILYRHERILLGREDCRPGFKKTIYIYIYIYDGFSLISRDASIRLGSRLL